MATQASWAMPTLAGQEPFVPPPMQPTNGVSSPADLKDSAASTPSILGSARARAESPGPVESVIGGFWRGAFWCAGFRGL